MGDTWSDSAVWADDSLRREVFFFESGRKQLYGSLYASTRRSRPVGLVICSSWGIEAHRMGTLAEAVARKAAKRGGAALVFHYPGFGDSSGRPESIGMEDLVAAAIDASAEASRRETDVAWGFAGLRLGASVAALARRRAGVRHLLLIQPALDPTGYFEEVLAKTRRAALGRDGDGRFAFGYPIPEAILKGGSTVASVIGNELSELDGSKAVAVQYETPDSRDPALERLERIVVSGTWRFGLKRYPTLKRGALNALRQIMGSEQS